EAVLLASEAEGFVQSLQSLELTRIGDPQWQRQHQYIEKLNMQAVLSVAKQQDEFVPEFVVNHGKLETLMHDLLVTEVWKEKIFPLMISNSDFKPQVTFPIYLVLYHEATVLNLLETLSFHSDVVESLGEVALDLIDYCHRKLVKLTQSGSMLEDGLLSVRSKTNSGLSGENETGDSARSSLSELEQQRRSLEFELALKCVTVSSNLLTNSKSLSLSALTRALNVHDYPLLFASLIELRPWKLRHPSTGSAISTLTMTVDQAEFNSGIVKLEGCVWLALYEMLTNSECQRKYEMTNYRKNFLLKLRSHLHETVLDQLSFLVPLRQGLEHMALLEPAPYKKELLLEQLPEVRAAILDKYQAALWSDTYNLDVLEAMLAEPPKCAACGAPAVKRCSRCQNEWYCRRECQVGHWTKHKPACDLMLVVPQNKPNTGAIVEEVKSD
uniref:Zinc finger MYND domain-containing protein 10 n=1 Tax=Macrostomum lignano TaxID=282301 RepID=A0A1I8GCW6_9PLAT